MSNDSKEIAQLLNARFWAPTKNLLSLNRYRDDYAHIIDEIDSKNSSQINMSFKAENKTIYVVYEVINRDSYDFADEIKKIRHLFTQENWDQIMLSISREIAQLRNYYTNIYTSVFMQFIDEKDKNQYRMPAINPKTSTLYFNENYARQVGITFTITEED